MKPPQLGGLPHLETFTWQIVTLAYRVTLSGRPGTRFGGLPHLSCKRDQDKMRDYMERRVTPPRRVTSPTWGPPPPCKHALKHTVVATFIIWLVFVLNAAIFFFRIISSHYDAAIQQFLFAY